jgi:hypothetical protein
MLHLELGTPSWLRLRPGDEYVNWFASAWIFKIRPGAVAMAARWIVADTKEEGLCLGYK